MSESSRQGASNAPDSVSPQKTINTANATTQSTKYVPPALRSEQAGKAKEMSSDQKFKSVQPAPKPSSGTAKAAPQAAPSSSAPGAKKHKGFNGKKSRKANAEKRKQSVENKKPEKPSEQKEEAKRVENANANNGGILQPPQLGLEKHVAVAGSDRQESTQIVATDLESRSVKAPAEDASHQKPDKDAKQINEDSKTENSPSRNEGLGEEHVVNGAEMHGEIKPDKNAKQSSDDSKTKGSLARNKEVGGKQGANGVEKQSEIEQQVPRAETAAEVQSVVDQRVKENGTKTNGTIDYQVDGKYPGREAKDTIGAKFSGTAENERPGQDDEGQWTVVVKNKKTPNKTPIKSNPRQRSYANAQTSPISKPVVQGNRNSPQRVGSWTAAAPAAKSEPATSNGISLVETDKTVEQPGKSNEEVSVQMNGQSPSKTNTRVEQPGKSNKVVCVQMNGQSQEANKRVEGSSSGHLASAVISANSNGKTLPQMNPQNTVVRAEDVIKDTEHKVEDVVDLKDQSGKEAKPDIQRSANTNQQIDQDKVDRLLESSSSKNAVSEERKVPEPVLGVIAESVQEISEQPTQPATQIPVPVVETKRDDEGLNHESEERKDQAVLTEAIPAIKDTHKVDQETKPQEEVPSESAKTSEKPKVLNGTAPTGIAKLPIIPPKAESPRMRAIREKAQEIHERMLEAKPFDIEGVRTCFDEEDVQAIRGLVFSMGTGIKA